MSNPQLSVIAFPGAPNLPTFAGLEQGLFTDRGVEVTFDLTTSSVAQAKGMAAGDFDIAFTAFDNVVAYSTGQGAAWTGVDPHYVVVMGATQLELSLVAEPSVDDHGDLAGRSIALDALETGFAFVLYEMLDRAGVDRDSCEFVAVGATPQRWEAVRAGKHAATLTIEPFTSVALSEGFRVIDSSTRLFVEYQGGVVAVRRPVLEERPEAIEAFIGGYLESLAWVLDPAHRSHVADLLRRRMSLADNAIDPVVTSVLSPASGLTPQARVLPEGMKTVLELRSRHGRSTVPDDFRAFCDLSIWEAVVEPTQER